MDSFDETILETTKIDSYPFVSVILPVLNEASYIDQCLSSLLRQDYPKAKYEILVVDNGSTDGTLSLLSKLSQESYVVKVLQVRQKNTAYALNIGIENSRGSIIVRMDAHAEAPVHYISTCVKYLLKNTADNVGGVVATVNSGYWGTIVSLVQSSRFGVGSSKFRCDHTSGYDEAGWPGSFWKDTLVRLGGYDDSLNCNEDDDLNFRLINAGGKVLRTADIEIKYFCRDSLRKLFCQYFRYGFYKVDVIERYGKLTSIRHLVPSAFLLFLVGSLILGKFFSPFSHLPFLTLSVYCFASIAFASWLSVKNSWKYFPFLPVGFATLHLGYGIGFLSGILHKFPLCKPSEQKTYSDSDSITHTPVFTGDPALIIFDDLVCHFDGETYSTDDSHIIFMLGMKRYCSTLSLFSRVSPTRGEAAYKIPQNVEIHSIPYYTNVPHLCKNFLKYLPLLVRLVKNNIGKYDVISLMWPHPISLLIIILNKVCRVDPILLIMVRGNLKAAIRARYQGIFKVSALLMITILERQLKLWAPQAIIATVGMESYKQYVNSFHHVQLITCPLFERKNIPKLKPNPSSRSPGSFRILFVGRLDAQKNLPLLLECAVVLKKEIKGICVDIVGTGPDEKELQDQVQKLNLTDVVSFHGYVRFGEELFTHYRNADCFVLPSLEGEGFPKVLIESKVLGVPIIATRVGGIPYLISHKENGWLVEPGSTSAIVEAVRELIKEPELTEKIRQRAKSDSQNYTMEHEQAKILSPIAKVLMSKRQNVLKGTLAGS